MSVSFTATDSADYEPGVYRARLIGMEQAEGSALDEKTGQPRIYIRWTFELLEEGYEGRTIRANSSTNFGTMAKARTWAGVLLGRMVETGERIDEADLIDRECNLLVALEKNDRGTFAKVETLTPLRKRARSGSGSAELRTVGESGFEDITN
jgi:hypothetical protein